MVGYLLFNPVRPMNAFMAWSKEERRKMVEEGSSLNNSLMSRILGHRWKQLGEAEKKAWKKTAEKLKKEHAKVRTDRFSCDSFPAWKPPLCHKDRGFVSL